VSVDQIQDVEVLRNLVKVQLRESGRLKAELAEAHAKLKDKNPREAEQLALKLERLERQHAAALQMLFGTKSERRPKELAPKARDPQKGHGPKTQPTLDIEELQYTLPEEERVCELCQKPLVEWEMEESEDIELVSSRLVVRRHRRQKYRCTCGGCIKTADGPRRLFPKARYGINFALHVALQKYVNHMPLDRQARDFARQGLRVTTATLWDYLSALYTKLEPAMKRLHQHVLSQPVLGMDETRWKLLKTAKKGKSKCWWVWVQRTDDAVHYVLNPSRSGEVAKQLLTAYTGTVVVDGYSGYEMAERALAGVQLAHCWSHARREVLPFEKDPRAARVLGVIQRMYHLEALAKRKGLSQPELLQWRTRKTKPLLEALFRWLVQLEVEPTTELRGALQYIVKRQVGLTRFLDEPRLAPDNNATERAIRGVVIGRKNHYGSRSERGTQVAALFYSLVDSADLAGVNPRDYLAAAIDAALDEREIPLPHEYAKTAREAA